MSFVECERKGVQGKAYNPLAGKKEDLLRHPKNKTSGCQQTRRA